MALHCLETNERLPPALPTPPHDRAPALEKGFKLDFLPQRTEGVGRWSDEAAAEFTAAFAS